MTEYVTTHWKVHGQCKYCQHGPQADDEPHLEPCKSCQHNPYFSDNWVPISDTLLCSECKNEIEWDVKGQGYYCTDCHDWVQLEDAEV